jgi:hypothetical protein
VAQPGTDCKILGFVLIAAGIAGFFKNDLRGLQLTTIHNIVHLVTGGIALYFGFATTVAAARMFCLILGIVGFIAPIFIAAIIQAHGADGNILPDNIVHRRAFHGYESITTRSESAQQGRAKKAAALYRGQGETDTRALSFTTLIIANLSLILTNRSWSRTILDSLRSPNAALWWVLIGVVAFLGLARKITNSEGRGRKGS